MKRLMIAKLIVALTFLVSSANTFSYTVKKQTLEELFNNSVLIARIKIISSEKVIVNSNSKSYECGQNYQAKVIESFKGGNSLVNFRTGSALSTGKEYLVFFNEEYMDAYVEYLSMGKEDTNSFQICHSEEMVYASSFHGEIYEIDEIWKTITGQEIVKVKVENISFPSDLIIKRIELQNEQVSKEYLDHISFGYLSWSEFQSKLLFMKDREDK